MLRWALLLVLAAAPARAEPAYARFATWLRAVPDAAAQVTDEIGAGQRVERGACTGGWCRVAAGRAQGFAAASMLDPAPPPAKAPTEAGCFPARHATPAGPVGLRICPAR